MAVAAAAAPTLPANAGMAATSSMLPCEALPMIMIYPPPPQVIRCRTPWGSYDFVLPPGTVLPLPSW